MRWLDSGFPCCKEGLEVDEDMEIIFTTQRGSNSGELFAIHHDGTDVDGFPVNINEKMLVGPATGDLEGDGALDIIVVTWNQNIIAVSSDGNIKSGFPFSVSGSVCQRT